MPRPGGESDKLGNQYEGIFLAKCVLDVLAGEVERFEVEPLDPIEGVGVELYRERDGGPREYWSVKRQRRSAFTFAALLTPQPTLPHGIWGAAVEKLTRQDEATFRFFSQTVSDELFRLPELARKLDAPERLAVEAAATSQIAAAHVRLKEASRSNADEVFSVLRRFYAVAQSQSEAVRIVEALVRRNLTRVDGAALDASGTRLLLTDFVISQLGTVIDRRSVDGFLTSCGLAVTAWARSDVQGVLGRWNAPFLERVRRTLVNGQMISRSESRFVLDAIDDGRTLTVLSAGGGFGKSTVLAHVVEQLADSGTPVGLVRLDSLEPMDSRELGRQMGLPESPALVLGADGPGVLILDQLDALSVTSGRNQRLRPLLHELLAEAARNPGLRLVLACRSFDLNFDDELRAVAASPDTLRLELGHLGDDDIAAALRDAGVTSAQLRSEHTQLLGVPRNLYMFTRLSASQRVEVASLLSLWDAYWETLQRTVRDRVESDDFAAAIWRLADAMADRESLAVPVAVLDGYEMVRDCLASESVIIRDERTVAFFHESFLDYAVARSVTRGGRPVVDWLRSLPEQSLFRRSQVRQVLELRRVADENAYLRDVDELLHSPDVRFHLKQLVVQWLGQEQARPQEWKIIDRHLKAADPQMQQHLLGIVRNKPEWFDLLRDLGVWDRWLTEDEPTRDRAVELFAMPDVIAVRGEAIGQFLIPRVNEESWRNRLVWLVSRTSIHHEGMQNLFLELLRLGHLDSARPGFAVNDDFWSMLYSDATAEPEFTARAIAVLLGRRLDVARAASADPEEQRRKFWPREHSQTVRHVVIESSDRAPLEFARCVLPTVLRVAEDLGDATFTRMSGGGHDLYTLSLHGLERALGKLAVEAPGTLAELFPAQPPTTKTDAFLRLSAYASNPAEFAEATVRIFLGNPAYLLVEHDIAGFGPSERNAGSAAALEAIGPYAAPETLQDLEAAILKLSGERDRHGESYGETAWRLLRRLPREAMTVAGRRRLDELERKFSYRAPDDYAIRIGEVARVQSPIPAAAVKRMSDNQIISAMSAFRSDRMGSGRGDAMFGGLFELSVEIESVAKDNPERFLRLALSMPPSVPSTYFDRILRALAQVASESEVRPQDDLWNLVRRMDSLEGKPCGEAIADAIARLAPSGVPDDVFLSLSWYAEHDPDPAPGDDWLVREENVDANNHELWRLDSVRAHATWALHDVLALNPDRADLISDSLDALCNDPVLSVRAALAHALTPTLSAAPALAMTRFSRLATDVPDWFLGLPPVRLFIHFAVYYEYDSIRPILLQALQSSSAGAVRTAAGQIAIASFQNEQARTDAAVIHKGSAEARAAAAEVYSENCTHASYGEQCREGLRAAFADEAKVVQEAAAKFVWSTPAPELVRHSQLIEDFVRSPAFHNVGPGSFFVRLEDAPPLPVPTVALIGKKALESIGSGGGNIALGAAADAHALMPLVFRAYADCERGQRADLLDIIDGAFWYRWYGTDQSVKEFESIR